MTEMWKSSKGMNTFASRCDTEAQTHVHDVVLIEVRSNRETVNPS